MSIDGHRMTIYVAEQEPDTLVRAFGGLAMKAPLKYADMAFWQEQDRTVSGAVERKKPGDVANGIITGRLVEQLGLAREHHRHVWLVIEGIYRAVSDVVEVALYDWVPLIPEISSDRWEGALTTIEQVGRVGIRRTTNMQETVRLTIQLYKWVLRPEHTTWREGEYDPAPLYGKVPLVRRWARDLPGVGYELSKRIAERFPTAMALALAGEEELTEVDGIGKVKAAAICAAVREA